VRRKASKASRTVLAGVGHHRDVRVVLGRASDHAGAADVDVLDGLVERDAGRGRRLLERVERHRDQIDRPDPVPLERGRVLGQVAAGQDAAVHGRVQRLHASVEHLGKAGDLGHVDDRHAGVAEQAGGPAGGQDLGAQRVQTAREVDDARLVVDADEGTAHSAHELSLMWTCRPRISRRPSAKRRTASG
jgi:hypothetical protein